MSVPSALPSVEAPAVRELARRLLAHGASPRLARRVLARVESRDRKAEPAHPLDVAAEAIGTAFPRVVLRAPGEVQAVLALLGTPGSGRSSVARKLALRFRGTGRPVACVALEQARSSKPGWLAAWLAEQGVTATVVRHADGFPAASTNGADVVLIDTVGDLRADARAIATWERQDASGASWRRVGVLAADASAARLRAEARALSALGADCAVLTRLDRSSAPAGALEICAEHRLAVAFVCDGPRDESHLHRVEPDLAADLFLSGRIA
jgi:flagellar biosynthesis GTPase FlhF